MTSSNCNNIDFQRLEDVQEGHAPKFEDLPKEMISDIFTHLNALDLVIASRVCLSWKKITDDPELKFIKDTRFHDFVKPDWQAKFILKEVERDFHETANFSSMNENIHATIFRIGDKDDFSLWLSGTNIDNILKNYFRLLIVKPHIEPRGGNSDFIDISFRSDNEMILKNLVSHGYFEPWVLKLIKSDSFIDFVKTESIPAEIRYESRESEAMMDRYL